MADPNSHVPTNYDPIQTFENMPDESFNIDCGFSDDHPFGGNIMLDEDINQLVRDHRAGKNIMLEEDVNQLGRGHRAGKNIMLEEDTNQLGCGHRVGKNIMLDEDMNQFGRGRRVGKNIMLDEDMNQFGHGITSQAGPSGAVNHQSNEHMRGKFNPETLNCGNCIPLLQWPLPPEPYTCSSCQVLREIIHTIDGETRKFEIHGRIGMIFHGILEIRRGVVTASNIQYHMFDFCEETIHGVKEFLVQYCEEQTEAGYTMVKDPLLTFNEALSVGSDWDFGLDIDEILHGSPIHIGENVGQQAAAINQPNVPQPQAQDNEVRPRRTHKQQRDFIDSLRVKDVIQYFDLPLEDAAEELGIGTTALKKVCRREGLCSWPYRQINGLKDEIKERRKHLNSANSRKRARAEADIEKFEQEIASYSIPYR